jgi:hypothetical protein
MPHITIEYMIMIPLLVLQIFLFPLTASWLMNVWVNSRLTLALNNSASQLGSTVLQLYSTLNHNTTGTSNMMATSAISLPPYIEGHAYTGIASLTATGPGNASQVLAVTLTLTGTAQKTTFTVTLGPNAVWQSSTFVSNSANPIITAAKYANNTIILGFG